MLCHGLQLAGREQAILKPGRAVRQAPLQIAAYTTSLDRLTKGAASLSGAAASLAALLDQAGVSSAQK